mgnify:CR=1 FL=1
MGLEGVEKCDLGIPEPVPEAPGRVPESFLELPESVRDPRGGTKDAEADFREGFTIIRFFDIAKPFPANWIDKNMKSSYGILLDDIIAGIYTIIVLFLINVFI